MTVFGIKIIIFAIFYCWRGILVACKFVILIRGVGKECLFLFAASGFITHVLDWRLALFFALLLRRLAWNAFLFRGHGATGSYVVVIHTTMAAVSAFMAAVAAPAAAARAAGG